VCVCVCVYVCACLHVRRCVCLYVEVYVYIHVTFFLVTIMLRVTSEICILLQDHNNAHLQTCNIDTLKKHITK
jgi:hypothetical protein